MVVYELGSEEENSGKRMKEYLTIIFICNEKN